MHRLILVLITAGVAAVLAAQDDRFDIALAFPSTTMVYATVDDASLRESVDLNEMFSALGDEDAISLKQILSDRLELKLTDAELSALEAGTRRSAIALLDVAVSGPKFQFVIEHADLSALARALKQGHADAIRALPDVKDHFGTPVYSLYLAPQAQDIQPGRGFNMNPLSGWMNQEEFWVSIYDNRFLVAGNSYSAVTDSVDFLSFPEDTVDTLVSSARYREAIREFKQPDALLYVSVESIITAVERLAGDQGGSPMWQFMPFFWDIDAEGWQFFIRLLQYEQFKSAAAAMWIDTETSTLRVDVGFSFHNPPGWYEALRIPPAKRPFADLIPADATLALTECVRDPMALYNSLKEFVFTRARNAGQGAIIENWEEWENDLVEDRAGLDELLNHLGGEQALVLLPRESKGNVFDLNPVSVAVMLSVKDLAAAEDYLFEKLLSSSLGEGLRPAEGALTPVEVFGGLEIHHAGDGSISFALMAREDGSGVFLFGQQDAIKRIVQARANGTAVDTMPAWRVADSMLPDASSIGLYVNTGGVIHVVGNYLMMMQRWMWDDEPEDNFNRDDTDKDADPVPYLAEFFAGTVVVGGAHSEESSMRLRLVAAGWPSGNEMAAMTTHFRDVKRNEQVRDDLLQIRESAFTHFAIHGTPPSTLEALLEGGYLDDREATIDAFNDEPYLIADVPADVDSRQGVLLAYQSKPGLRGLHLAVLWNSHIVALTPGQLAEAIDRASRGEALAEERYRDGLRALFHEDLRPTPMDFPVFERDDAELVVIDDEGNEEELRVEKNGLRQQAEGILDEKEEAGKKEVQQDDPVEEDNED